MHILILTPHDVPSTRGNAVTAHRIAVGLERRGHTVHVLTGRDVAAPDRWKVAAGERPSIVHGLHATQLGAATIALANGLGVPSALTITGTDISQDAHDSKKALVVAANLRGASAIVTFDASIAADVAAFVPEVASRIHVIPQAPLLDADPYSLREAYGYSTDRVLLVLAGGIRPVKNNAFPIEPLARLAGRDARVALALAGPIIDDAYFAKVQALLVRHPFARYLGDIPHSRMMGAYPEVDLALNCSLSEGGMANAVLEAQWLDVPVLASDIPGNRSLVREGQTGSLYRDAADLAARVGAFLDDPAPANAMARRAGIWVREQFSPDCELDRYEALYRSLAACTH